MRVKRISKPILMSLLTLSVLLSIAGHSSAQVYYILASGDDGFSGTSLETAWKTIAKANRVLTAGDTVYIRAGTYSGRIEPKNSGSPSSPIGYARYQGETVTLTNDVPVYSNGYEGPDHVTIDGFTFSNNGRAIHLFQSDHWEIKNCDFSGSTKYASITLVECSNVYVHDNMIYENGSTGIELYKSSQCVVEGNTISDGGHHSCMELSYSKYNIIRNNTFRTTGALPAGDRVDTMVMVLKKSNYNLFEKNTFYETGADYGDGHCAAFKIQNGSHIIFRKNIIYDVDLFFYNIYTSDSNLQVAEKNTIYQNTSYNCGLNNERIWFLGAITLGYIHGGYDCQYNRFVNNIIHSQGQYGFGIDPDGRNGEIHDNVYQNNIMYNITKDDVQRYLDGMTVEQAEATHPGEFSGNKSQDPKLSGPDNQDFSLRSDSPAIDAGTHLATIISSTGTGTSFKVDHPEFFFDGNGISGEKGDTIRTIDTSTPAKDKQVTTITGVNYSTGVITVDTSISWTQNVTRIALDYAGSGPDIGAYEYVSDAKVVETPGNLRIKTES